MIGWFGPQAWPPRSSDLTIMDFYFWGYVKQNVYKEQSDNDLELFKNEIADVIRTMPLKNIRNSYQEFRKGVVACADVGRALCE